MFKVLSQFFAQLGAIWKKIGVGQRVTIVLVGVILMVSLWALTKFAQKPHYDLLYSNISVEDSGKICSFLKDEKVAYTLKNNGRTIYVDSKKVQEMRVMLAEKRLLPREGGTDSGLLFGKKGFADTERMQNVKIKKDLEWKIAQDITWFETVDAASVSLAIPEPTYFGDPVEETAAGKLRLNRELSKQQVGTIQYLVSHSVAGLKPENVSVADNQGNTLSDMISGDSAAALTSSQLEYQRSVEQSLTEKAQTMLNKTLGPGKARVEITADIDFEDISKETLKYSEGAVTQKSKIVKTNTGAGTGASGVPGMNANAESAGTVTAAGKNEDKTEETTYSDPSVVKTIKTTPPGSIKKLSVALFVDAAIENTPEIEDIVKSAVGFNDKDRKDEMTTVTMAFYQPEEVEEAAAVTVSGKPGGMIMMIVKNGGAVVGIVVLLMFFKMMFKKTRIETILAQESKGAPVHEIEEEEIELPQVEKKKMVYSRELARMTDEDPENVARILRDWLGAE